MWAYKYTRSKLFTADRIKRPPWRRLMNPGDLIIRDGRSIWLERNPWDDEFPDIDMIDTMMLWDSDPIGLVIETRESAHGNLWAHICTSSGVLGWTMADYLNSLSV